MASIMRQVPGEPEPADEPVDDRQTALAIADDIQIIPDPLLPASAPGLAPKSVALSQHAEYHGAREKRNSLRRRLVVGDVFALSAVWGAQAVARAGQGFALQIALGALAVVVTLAVMEREGLYRSRVCAMRSLEAVRVVFASAVGTAAFVSCDALTSHGGLVGSLRAGALAGAAAVAAILSLRWRFSRWLLARRSASKFLRTVILVGTNEDAEAVWTLLADEPELGYRVGGVAGDRRPGAPWEGLPTCTEIVGLTELAHQTGANGVIVVASSLVANDRKNAVARALDAGLHVQVWAGLDGLSSRRTRMAPVSGLPLIYVERREVSRWQLTIKRAMDLVLASLLTLVTAPLLAAAAIAIKLTDRGPIIYRSQRVGRHGATIEVLKLRTMVQDASKLMVDITQLNERTGGPLFKATDDPRVTKIGHLLRATSIDELPQLWNVLNGTMSLVGPRPALLHEVEQFDPELRRRHEMRPGITGLWQVEARDNPSFSAYRRLDLSYIDDFSVGLDIAIIASTVHQLVARASKALLPRKADREGALETRPESPVPGGMAGELGRERV